MKKKMLILSILLIIISFVLNSEVIKSESNIFKKLDELVKKEKWGTNNKDKAKVFEEIYNENVNSNNFITKLEKYINNPDKSYWIGIYLSDKYYTNINNIELSIQILKKGLKFNISDEDKTRVYWIIGYTYFFNNKLEESKSYLLKADKLSEEYPGNRPALSDEDYEKIDNFIISIKK